MRNTFLLPRFASVQLSVTVKVRVREEKESDWTTSAQTLANMESTCYIYKFLSLNIIIFFRMFHRAFFEVFLFGFCIDLYVKGAYMYLPSFAVVLGKKQNALV